MFGPIAFVGAVALIVGIYWLLAGLAKSGNKESDDEWAAREQQTRRIRKQDEIGAMILAGQQYENRQAPDRAIAEWEAQR